MRKVTFKIPTITIHPVLKGFAFASIIFMLCIRLLGTFTDPDMWWHIRLGGEILVSKWINTFTYTCTDYLWVNHSWLSDVVINIIHENLGLVGLSIFFALIFFAGIIFSFLSLKEILAHKGIKNTRLNTLLYILFFILILSSFVAVRPQVFTFMFFNALIFLLIKFHYSVHINYLSLIFFALFFILWVNLHGGFVIGLALIGVFIVDTFFNFLVATFKNPSNQPKLLLKKCIYLTILLVFFLVCSFANPFGLNLWKEIIAQLLGSNNSNFIMEWRAINIKDTYHLFYFILFMSALVLQVINKSKSSLRLLLLVSFGFLSFYSVRYVLSVSGIVLLVLFVEFNVLFDSLLKNVLLLDKDLKRLMLILKYFLICFISIMAGMGAYLSINYFKSLTDLNTPDSPALATYPVSAVNYLKDHKSEYLDLNFYNTYVWGGYLEYTLPDFNWIIDGRMPEWKCGGQVKSDLMQDYMETENVGRQWKEVLNKNNVKGLFIQTNSTLYNVVSADPQWRIAYTDSLATIFVKND